MNMPLETLGGQPLPAITQRFGANPGVYDRFGYPGHNGLDLWTDARPPRVFCIAPGQVEKVGWEAGGYGKYVVVRHPGGWRSYYAHLERVSALPGQRLEGGDPLGWMGSTGFSSGPHLHLGIRLDDPAGAYRGYIDPLPVLLGETLLPALPPEEAAAPAQPAPGSARPAVLQPARLVIQRGRKTVYRMRRIF